uniref:phenylalanine--tRNA ligase n=1 Tax=Caenorhabditis tropicalis TaxID=1561998 RepID=A0A1I7V0Z4_9PELO
MSNAPSSTDAPLAENDYDDLFAYGQRPPTPQLPRPATPIDSGPELDEITYESAEEEEVEVYTDVNDLHWSSVEALSRATRIFNEDSILQRYEFGDVVTRQKLIVKSKINLKVIAVVIRDVSFDEDSYASFIDLQDKLHQNICRKRTLVAIGTHDLDLVQGPFELRAEAPSKIKFCLPNQTKEYTATEMMQYFSGFSNNFRAMPQLPVLYDKTERICSMPPIINGEHSKITIKTKNVFIEATATDKQKACVVLDTIVTLFSQYCQKPFHVEQVEIEYEETGEKDIFPFFNQKNKNKHGRPVFKYEEMAILLNKMSLKAEIAMKCGHKVIVTWPTPPGALREIIQDVDVGYGYDKLMKKRQSNTVAVAFSINKLCDKFRIKIATFGWTEALSFALCSRDDISTKLRLPKKVLSEAVHIGNPKTLEFQVARTSLLPGLLKTLASNRDMPLPLKLFELQDVILKDEKMGARNERRLAAVYYNKAAGLEIIQGFLDRMMRMLNVKPIGDPRGYQTKKFNHVTFEEKNCYEVHSPSGEILGRYGVLHSEVTAAFGLTLPCEAMEISISSFFPN